MFVFTQCTVPGEASRTPAYSDVDPENRSFNGLAAGESDELEQSQEMKEPRFVYNGNLSLKVKNLDTTNHRIAQIAARYEGYFVQTGSWGTNIRVKSANVKAAMEELKTLGKVTHVSLNAEDVTDKFTDLDIRLENARLARARYLELLAKAENVEAALKVEKELERLNGEIDQLEGQISQLEHSERYSLISVHVDQKTKPGVIGYVFVGLWEGVSWLFVRG